MVILRRSRDVALLLYALLTASFAPSEAVAGSPGTLAVTVNGHTLVGRPLHWNNSLVSLLTRDGYLREFAPADATEFRQTSPTFQPYGYAEMRGSLLAEFGRGFEVSGTGHYIVVHPAGQRDVWANRFEELYRSFQHYFTQRGFRLQEPQFPLVAVVFGSRQDFDRYASQQGTPVSGETLGYYWPISNRVMLYDIDDGQSSEWGRSQNAATIIHEATHQTAFNTGIHNRFGITPRWLAEGLGTMFEAPGVWQSREHVHLSDRINREYLASYRSYLPRRKAGALAEMVASERFFLADADGAYAEAWATTFYLAERETARFAEYIARVAARPEFQPYSPQQRLQDFQSVFGDDLRMLEIRVQRFMAELP